MKFIFDEDLSCLWLRHCAVACWVICDLLKTWKNLIKMKWEKNLDYIFSKSGLYILYSPDFENPDYKQIYSYVHKLNIFMIWSIMVNIKKERYFDLWLDNIETDLEPMIVQYWDWEPLIG